MVVVLVVISASLVMFTGVSFTLPALAGSTLYRGSNHDARQSTLYATASVAKPPTLRAKGLRRGTPTNASTNARHRPEDPLPPGMK